MYTNLVTYLGCDCFLICFYQESGSVNGEVKKDRPDEPVPLSKVNTEQRNELVQLYGLPMPEDLFHFWDFCQELCPDDPRGMFVPKHNADRTKRSRVLLCFLSVL